MAKGFIMMTALPPTRGHAQLIRWAREYCDSAGIQDLHVMVCSQPHEPYPYRWFDLESELDRYMSGIIVHNYHRTMPQKPEDDNMFWGKWQAEIFHTIGMFAEDDVVISSETYGFALARVLGCRHIPYDISRSVVATKAARVRDFPITNFGDMLPSSQQRFRKTVTIFGAESTGKTTLAYGLSQFHAGNLGHYTPEWARPYLESLPTPAVKRDRMEVITHGQRATEQAVKSLEDKPFIIRDTDLLSTVGYYGLYSVAPPIAVDKADLYIVCPSNIPFEPDPLRYGGDKRESTDDYWIKLLQEWDCNYIVLNTTTPYERKWEAYMAMTSLFMQDPLWSYKRE